jgi:hypothetical protein
VQREPGKQPPAVLSIAFAGLALACLGGLVVALLAIVGVNFKVSLECSELTQVGAWQAGLGGLKRVALDLS